LITHPQRRKYPRETEVRNGQRRDPEVARRLATRPVSEDSEASALAALVETVAALLDAYPTSDEEDEALLRIGAEEKEEEEEDEEAGKTSDDDDDDADAALNAKRERREKEKRERRRRRRAAEAASNAAAGRAPLTGVHREAVRCRLREKLLLVNCLNSLRRVAAQRLRDAPFELDFGASAGGKVRADREDDAKREGSVSPPEGFSAGKKTRRRTGGDGEL
jgi:hypothetical protein